MNTKQEKSSQFSSLNLYPVILRFLFRHLRMSSHLSSSCPDTKIHKEWYQYYGFSGQAREWQRGKVVSYFKAREWQNKKLSSLNIKQENNSLLSSSNLSFLSSSCPDTKIHKEWYQYYGFSGQAREWQRGKVVSYFKTREWQRGKIVPYFKTREWQNKK